MKKTNNGGTVDNRTNKLFICTDGCDFGTGNTPGLAYVDYFQNGSKSFEQCTFYNANEIKVELTIK